MSGLICLRCDLWTQEYLSTPDVVYQAVIDRALTEHVKYANSTLLLDFPCLWKGTSSYTLVCMPAVPPVLGNASPSWSASCRGARPCWEPVTVTRCEHTSIWTPSKRSLSVLHTFRRHACRYPASREMLRQVDAFCVRASVSLAAHSRVWPAFQATTQCVNLISCALSQATARHLYCVACNATFVLSRICVLACSPL